MNVLHLPSIQWQRQSPLDNRCAHSLLISLMRGLAAVQVAAAHLRSEMFPGLREISHPSLVYQLLAFATGFAHQAVVVFFLISGWLVGGSLLNKLIQQDRNVLRAYAIDRATRLWTVLLPAMCLMLVVGFLIGEADPAHVDASAQNEYSAASFIGNLVGLQTVSVKNFAGNYALWSLANETWYYIQFPLLLTVFLGHTRLRQLGAATALVLLCASLPLPITLYFALWLAGALFSRLRIDCTNGFRIGLVLLAAGCSVYFRLTGRNDDLKVDSFLQDLVYSLPLLAFLAAMQHPLDQKSISIQRLGRVAHLLSEFSFTLYVTHVPIIDLLRYLGMRYFGRNRLASDAPLDYAIYVGMLCALIAFAYLSYLLFESHTFRIRGIVKNLLQAQVKRPVVTPVSVKGSRG
jgi:peptidoglycan/LPS O-acetylase OafA/YrhL